MELRQLPALQPFEQEALALTVLETALHVCQLVHQGHPRARCAGARYPTGAESEPWVGGGWASWLLLGPLVCLQRAGAFQRPLHQAGQAAAGGRVLSRALAPVLECGGTFQFHDAMDGQLQGSVNLEAPGQGRLSGGATVSGSSSASMDLCTLRVAPNTWEAMHHER